MGRRDRSLVPVKMWWDAGPVPVTRRLVIRASLYYDKNKKIGVWDLHGKTSYYAKHRRITFGSD